MTRLDRPIIVVGTGRSGSTMFHRILARHEAVGWLSTFNEVFPTQTWLSVFSSLYRTPLPDGLRHAKAFPKPFEAYRFWERFLPGFSRRDRPLTADDVPETGIAPVRRAVANVLRFQARSRFLAKVTGWSRMGYFDRIFPDARFIFLAREHRAVVSSWVKAGWLDVTSEVDSESWQWGPVPPEYRGIWQDLGGGPVLSAAVKIQLDLDDVRRNLALFPDRSLVVRFEDVITQPHETLRTVSDFGGLDWSANWQRTIAGLRFYDPGDKWKEHLSEEQAAKVVDFFARAEAARLGDPS